MARQIDTVQAPTTLALLSKDGALGILDFIVSEDGNRTAIRLTLEAGLTALQYQEKQPDGRMGYIIEIART